MTLQNIAAALTIAFVAVYLLEKFGVLKLGGCGCSGGPKGFEGWQAGSPQANTCRPPA